ncbi:hypothetical protein CBR_g24014 [Chara braunii]|uniref:Uncharacterized protein n=1 Tax=Chara braunii TaxID=69332 RepID=A0A388L5J2_CHABU|nr:hypothetical protein CBR_g24014 [Chara braunii]|eukprot:GBG77567.1 hypothetical protein CBR_g24014 [Chara braunii]
MTGVTPRPRDFRPGVGWETERARQEKNDDSRREVRREGEEGGKEKGRHRGGRGEEEADKHGQPPRDILLIGGMKPRPQGTKRPRPRRKNKQREGKAGKGRKGKQAVSSSTEHNPSPKRCRDETEKGVLIFGEHRSVLGVRGRQGTGEQGSRQGDKLGKLEGEEPIEPQKTEEKRGGNGTVEDATAGAAEPTETDERSLVYLGEDPGGRTERIVWETVGGSGGKPGQDRTAESKKWGRGREEMRGAGRAAGAEGEGERDRSVGPHNGTSVGAMDQEMQGVGRAVGEEGDGERDRSAGPHKGIPVILVTTQEADEGEVRFAMARFEDHSSQQWAVTVGKSWVGKNYEVGPVERVLTIHLVEKVDDGKLMGLYVFLLRTELRLDDAVVSSLNPQFVWQDFGQLLGPVMAATSSYATQETMGTHVLRGVNKHLPEDKKFTGHGFWVEGYEWPFARSGTRRIGPREDPKFRSA